MSIGSIASNIWAQTTQLSSTLDPTLSAASASSSVTGTQSSSATTVAGQTGSVDPFQQLASDIQALLVQAQGGTSTATPAATGTTATDPEQQLATDLQSLMNQLQGTQTGTSQTASAEQTGATGQTHGHHHHHHEDTDTDASAATEASATTTPSSPATSANNQTVAQTLAADIVQALSAYGDTGTTSAASGLTA